MKLLKSMLLSVAALCSAAAVAEAVGNELPVGNVFLPHRIQTFATVGNVTFVDDSKGTNVHATLAALRCFEARPIALIVGGSDKGENFNELFADIPQTVVKVVAVGQTAERMHIAVWTLLCVPTTKPQCKHATMPFVICRCRLCL